MRVKRPTNTHAQVSFHALLIRGRSVSRRASPKISLRCRDPSQGPSVSIRQHTAERMQLGSRMQHSQTAYTHAQVSFHALFTRTSLLHALAGLL